MLCELAQFPIQKGATSQNDTLLDTSSFLFLFFFYLQEEDNLSTKDKLAGFKVSFIWRFHCMYVYIPVSLLPSALMYVNCIPRPQLSSCFTSIVYTRTFFNASLDNFLDQYYFVPNSICYSEVPSTQRLILCMYVEYNHGQ